MMSLQREFGSAMLVAVAMYLGWYLVADVGAFNIDATNPIVLRSSVQRSNSRPAYFGFSLVFHRPHHGHDPW